MKSLQIRATGASCKECRRLKIKCDKQVPCGTCTKRGLQSLCPDGQLSSTKGSRYVLASAEESWQRIQALCVRVQDLEFALERAHAALVASNPSVAASTSGNPNIGTHSTTPSGVGGVVGAGDRHPLLDPELIKIGQDPRAVMVGKNGGSNLASSSGELVNQGLGTTGGPNDVPVAQMGTMKMSKSGSFRWMATTALPGMVLDAFGDGVPEQDFEHAVSPDQYPDHPHSHSHQRQGSFSSASFPFSAGGENPDGTSVLPPVSGTTLNAGAQFGSSSSTTGSFGSAPFTPTIAGPLAFGSVYELKMYAIRQLPSSQQALHMIDTYFQFSWQWPVVVSRQTVMDTLYTPAYGGTPPSSSTPPSSYHHNHHQHGLADALSTYQLASLFSILAMAALYDPNLDATCPEFKARRKLARALFFAPSTYAYSNSIAAAAAAASAASSQLPTTSNGSVRFTTPNNVETSKEGAHGSGGGMERHFSPGAASDALSSHTNATTSTVSGNSTSTGASGSAGAAGASSGLFGISIGANNWDWIRSPRTLEEMESLLLLFRTAWPFLDTSPMENYEFLSWGFKVACKLGLHNDPEPLNLSLEEANRRRRIFWALWFHDSLLSLNFGQPPTLTKGFVNCQPPRNTSDHGEDLHPRLTVVVQDILRHFMESGSSPPYSAVLLLDRKIREIDPMRHAEPIYDLSGANSSTAPPDWRKEIAKAFSKGLKYMLLMSLHKTYFSYALLRPEENTISGKLALSISAMYEGATGLLECAQITSRNASWLQARYSPSWIHYQTSCLVLYAFPMYLPSSPKAEEAMKTADLAVSSLFQAHGRDCGVAAAGLPSLLKCQEKAKASMAKWRANQWTHPMASKEGGATATAPSTAEEGLPTEVFFNEKLVITNSASSAHNTSHDSRGSTPSDMVATASPSNFESNLGNGGTDGGHTGASGSVFGGESSCSSSAFQGNHWMGNGIDSPVIVSPDAGPSSFSGVATNSYFSPIPTGSSTDAMHEERMEDSTGYGRSHAMEWSNAPPVITKVETPPLAPINMVYGSQQMYSPHSQVPTSNLLQVPSPADDYPAPSPPVRRVRGLSRARSFPSDHVANVYPPISTISTHMYQPMISPHSLTPHSMSPPTPSPLSQHGVFSSSHHFQATATPPQQSPIQRPHHQHHDSYGQWIGHTIPDATGYGVPPPMHYASPSSEHHHPYPHHRHSQSSLHHLPQHSHHHQPSQAISSDHVAPGIPIHVLEQSWNNFSGQQR